MFRSDEAEGREEGGTWYFILAKCGSGLVTQQQSESQNGQSAKRTQNLELIIVEISSESREL